jgi:hypothetical protein
VCEKCGQANFAEVVFQDDRVFSEDVEDMLRPIVDGSAYSATGLRPDWLEAVTRGSPSGAKGGRQMIRPDTRVSFVDDVQQVVRRYSSIADPVEQQSQIDDGLAGLCGPDSGGILWRHHLTYAIEIGDVEPRATQYRWLRSLEIASAPDVVTMIPIAEGFVMVLRYWACRESEDIVPASRATFTQPARAQFSTTSTSSRCTASATCTSAAASSAGASGRSPA